MRRITFIITIAAALMVSTGLSGQDNQDRSQGHRSGRGYGWQEKIKAEKIAFLTSEMELTPEESQVFWPIYNQAEKEKWEALKKTRDAYKALSSAVNENKGDKEISKCLSTYLATSKLAGEIDTEYLAEYQKILPAGKIAKLYLGEEKFRKFQFQHMQGHKPGQGNGMQQKPRGTKPEESGYHDGLRSQRGESN